jgi:hypothetical protein
MRFAIPLFPDAAQAFAEFFVALGAISIVYGAIVATMQSEIRRLALYAVVSHAGFIVMGLFSLTAQGFVGGALQQVNHGVTMGAMFLLLGMLESRTRTLQIGELGGLKQQMPVFAALFLIVMLAAVALPGTNGFVGEFLCLLGGVPVGARGRVLAGLGRAGAAGHGAGGGLHAVDVPARVLRTNADALARAARPAPCGTRAAAAADCADFLDWRAPDKPHPDDGARRAGVDEALRTADRDKDGGAGGGSREASRHAIWYKLPT